MAKISIKELESPEEILAAFPVMGQLRPHLDEAAYFALVREAQEIEGYKLFALFEQDEIVAVIGFQPMITLYSGRAIWVSDLVTDSCKRSNGYGEKLLSYLHSWAAGQQYERIELSSGFQRVDAHRFYEQKMGYDKVGYVFRRSL